MRSNDPGPPMNATRATEELLRRSLELRVRVWIETRALAMSTDRLRTLTEGRPAT